MNQIALISYKERQKHKKIKCDLFFFLHFDPLEWNGTHFNGNYYGHMMANCWTNWINVWLLCSFIQCIIVLSDLLVM
jgi:hypothetical protein